MMLHLYIGITIRMLINPPSLEQGRLPWVRKARQCVLPRMCKEKQRASDDMACMVNIPGFCHYRTAFPLVSLSVSEDLRLRSSPPRYDSGSLSSE